MNFDHNQKTTLAKNDNLVVGTFLGDDLPIKDEVLKPENVSISKSAKINTSSHNFILPSVIIFVFLTIIGTGIYGFNNFLRPQKSSEPEPITSVQRSTRFVEIFASEPVSQISGTDELINDTYQPLLNYATKNNLTNFDVAKVSKDPQLKAKQISILNQLKTEMETSGTSYVNAEIVTLWFNNFPGTKYSLDERKNIVFELMTQLHQKIVNGELDMKLAGDQLKNNKTLSEIDSAWESNAYTKVDYAKKNISTFKDSKLQEMLWKLAPGEISPVLIYRDINGEEVAYVIIKILDHQEREYDSYEEFLKANE